MKKKGFTSQKGLVSDHYIMRKKRYYENINSNVTNGLYINFRDIAKHIKNTDFMLKDSD